MHVIRLYRDDDEDPSQLIAQAAKARHARIVGNLRWHGAMGPTYIGADLDDGTEVRVYPKSCQPKVIDD